MRHQRHFILIMALFAMFAIYAQPVFAGTTSRGCAVNAESANVPGVCDNPVSLGRAADVSSGGSTFKFAIAEVIRGKKAWQRLHSYSAFNKPPSEGKEYLMVLVVVRN